MTEVLESEPDLRELAAGQALGDLTPDENDRLSQFSQESVSRECDRFHSVAAAVQLMLLNTQTEPIPEKLRSRIEISGKEQLRRTESSKAVLPGNLLPKDGENLSSGSTQRNVREWIAWLSMAVAICIAVGLWKTRTGPALTVDLFQSRDALIASASDLVRVSWSDGKTPFSKPVTGEVVWSTKEQEGYMTFQSMPQNDPNSEQYQLWIIDPERDDEPIDGGVFDVSADGEVVVKIDAKLEVVKPVAFAITVEKPGGVVVSTQDRLPLLASVSG